MQLQMLKSKVHPTSDPSVPPDGVSPWQAALP